MDNGDARSTARSTTRSTTRSTEDFAAVEDVGSKHGFVNVTSSAPKNVHPPAFVHPQHPDAIHEVVTEPQDGVPVIRGSMNQGTVVQLMSVGPQDRFLSLNPQTSFFKTVYRRHTNFAVECIEEDFSTTGSLAFGSTTTCKFGKHGDLLGNIVLHVVLPDLGISGGVWSDAIGYVLFTRLRLRIGDVVVQTHERLWYDIEDKLFVSSGHSTGLDVMIGRGTTLATDRTHELYVPLKFFCCRTNSGAQQFLPVTGLDPNVFVFLEIDTETLENCVSVPSGTILPPAAVMTSSVLVDNVYVDAVERSRLVVDDKLYMFEIVRDVDQVSYATTSEGSSVPISNVTVDLRELNMPVKYFAIVAYLENYDVKFRYLDVVDTATLLINAEQQFYPRGFPYFSAQQTYDRFARCVPASNVGTFSFALDAGAWQPSGTLNFANLTNPTFRVALKSTYVVPLKVKLFASCLNWMYFDHGACYLMYDV